MPLCPDLTPFPLCEISWDVGALNNQSLLSKGLILGRVVFSVIILNILLPVTIIAQIILLSETCCMIGKPYTEPGYEFVIKYY